MLNTLRRFVSNPWVGMVASVVMLLAGLSEGWETFHEDIANADLRAHHGIIVYGFYAILKAIPDVFEGLEGILE